MLHGKIKIFPSWLTGGFEMSSPSLETCLSNEPTTVKKYSQYREIIPENIPVELKPRKIWVVWKPQNIPGKPKPGKLPVSYQVNKLTGKTEVKAASCDDPETWMTFEDALKLLNSSKKYKGLSIALSPEPPQEGEPTLIGVDLDKAVSPDGLIRPEMLEEIKAFNTYFELSPTDGLRGFCYGSFPVNEGVHTGNIEIYQSGKFLTVTGHKLGDFPATINEANKAINDFRAKYFKTVAEIDETTLPVSSKKFTDDELLEKLLNYKLKDQFKKLYYEGFTEGADHSVLDKNLCRLISFFTQDPEQIDRIFRKSALFRPAKWDKIHFSNGATYGKGTIDYVLKTRTVVFQGVNTKNQSKDSEFSLSIYPFNVDETGIYKKEYIYNKFQDEPGEKVIHISPTPCIVSAIGENIDNGEILYKLKIKDNKRRERIIWKTTSDLMKKADVTKLLKEGMHFKEADSNKMIEYFDKCITTNKDTLPSEIAASVSGWKDDYSLFVVGNRGITANGEIEVLPQENPTAELYTEKGSLSEWVQATNKIINYDAVRFKLYTACASPLLKLLNVKSFVETQQTPSGRLKTTMGWLAASIWGNPERLQLNAESTQAGIQKTVEFCTDLPIFVDETSITDRIKDMVYLIANGVGRSKSNSEGGLVMASTWSTIILTTGEKPILPESALTGQQVRVVPLRDGVNEKLPALEVKEIQNGITENYGHVGVLFLQELFKEKDNLNSLFNAFFSNFPEVEDITSDRAKEYYAVITLAGYLLERVFERIGVQTKDSSIVCKHYFNENVISNSFVPDHIKALNAAYSWFSSNEVYFQDDEEYPLNHERYGWIRKDKNHGICVCFIPDKLSKYLNTEIGTNTYEAVTDEWKALDILIYKEQIDNRTGNVIKIKKNQISTPGGKKQVIKIPLSKFEEYLKLDAEEDNKNKNKNTEDPKTPDPAKAVQQTLKEPAKNIPSENTLEKPTSEPVNSDSDLDNIIVTDNEKEAAELMAQEGF